MDVLKRRQRGLKLKYFFGHRTKGLFNFAFKNDLFIERFRSDVKPSLCPKVSVLNRTKIKTTRTEILHVHITSYISFTLTLTDKYHLNI